MEDVAVIIPPMFHPPPTYQKELDHLLYRREKMLAYELVKIQRLQLDEKIRRRIPIFSASLPTLRKTRKIQKTRKSRKSRNEPHNSYQRSHQSSHQRTQNISSSTSLPSLSFSLASPLLPSSPSVQVWKPEVNFIMQVPVRLTKKQRKEQRNRRAQLKYAHAQMTKRKDLWERRLDKLQIPARKYQRNVTTNRCKGWLKLIKTASFCTQAVDIFQQFRAQRQAEYQAAKAASLIGNSLKQSYSRKKRQQHRRSSEILRERCWIARMNVRSRMRKQGASIVRDFVVAAVEASRFSVICKTYRYKIICIQRKIKNFIDIHRIRLKIMIRMFRKYEGRVHRRLDRERKERERVEDALREADLLKSAKQARSAKSRTRRTKKAKSNSIRIFLKEIDECGRQLDSVAFRLLDQTKQANKRVERGKSSRKGKGRCTAEYVKVKKVAVLHVLTQHLRKKRKEHYIGMIELRKKAKERLRKVKEVDLNDMYLSIAEDLSVTDLYAKKMKNEEQRAVVYPVVQLFTTLKEDLLKTLVMEAIAKEAEMNREDREKALKNF